MLYDLCGILSNLVNRIRLILIYVVCSSIFVFVYCTSYCHACPTELVVVDDITGQTVIGDEAAISIITTFTDELIITGAAEIEVGKFYRYDLAGSNIDFSVSSTPPFDTVFVVGESVDEDGDFTGPFVIKGEGVGSASITFLNISPICRLNLTVVENKGDVENKDDKGTIKGQLKSTALVETTDGNEVQNATVELKKQDSFVREQNGDETNDEYLVFLAGKGQTFIDRIVVQPSDNGGFLFEDLPVSDSESNDIFYTIEVQDASASVLDTFTFDNQDEEIEISFLPEILPNVKPEVKKPFTVHDIILHPEFSNRVCDSTSVSKNNLINITNSDSVLYVIGGDKLTKSTVSVLPSSIVVSISPQSITSATDHVYTITPGFEPNQIPSETEITIEWETTDPDCLSFCKGSCEFRVLLLNLFSTRARLIAASAGINAGLGGLEDITKLIFLQDEPVAAPAAAQIEESVDTINNSVNEFESVVDELTPIVGLRVRDDLRSDIERENGSLALKNSTTDNSELVELLEKAVTNFEEAIASLEKIEVGMLAGDAILLLQDAIVSLKKGQDPLESVIEALEELEDGGGKDDGDGVNPGFQCSSLLGIPQTKPMKKLMNKLRDRVESNWTVDHDYIELFNDNMMELTQIVNSRPALASRLVSERTRLMPSILLLIFGEPVELTTTDVKRIEEILDAISTYASPQLEDAIDQIQSDLHSEEIMSSFGISVE